MSNRILPPHADNTYRGRKLALWLFGLVVLMRASMSVGSIFRGYAVATGPDAIPLHTYPVAAAQTVVSLFALLGLATLVICLVCGVVLARYRSLVPFMFVVLLLHQLGGRLIAALLPIARTVTSPGTAINLVLSSIVLVGLILSLVPDHARSAPA